MESRVALLDRVIRPARLGRFQCPCTKTCPANMSDSLEHFNTVRKCDFDSGIRHIRFACGNVSQIPVTCLLATAHLSVLQYPVVRLCIGIQ